MRLKWPSRHKENYPFLVTCSFLWVTKIAINFPLGKHFSWPITCEWKTEGKLGLRYHISKEKLKEVILGQIFTLTSFLNNLLNFLRVILENAIGSTDKYKHSPCNPYNILRAIRTIFSVLSAQYSVFNLSVCNPHNILGGRRVQVDTLPAKLFCATAFQTQC